MTPTMTGPDGWTSNTGPPESPVHAPSPSRVPWPAASTRRICKLPGLPVATRTAARTVPPLLPSPRTVTPMPAMENLAPGTIGSCGVPSTAIFSLAGDLSCNSATSAVARCASIACTLNCGCLATFFYVLQLRLPVGAIFHDLVFGTSLHAMRHRQHQRRRDQRAGTEIAARTDDGDD